MSIVITSIEDNCRSSWAAHRVARHMRMNPDAGGELHQAVEDRQGLMVACLEEIAFRLNTSDQTTCCARGRCRRAYGSISGASLQEP